jgi:hypothetical protein
MQNNPVDEAPEAQPEQNQLQDLNEKRQHQRLRKRGFIYGYYQRSVAPQLTVVMLPLPFPVVVSAWVDVLGVWVQPKGAGGP